MIKDLLCVFGCLAFAAIIGLSISCAYFRKTREWNPMKTANMLYEGMYNGYDGSE